jgi:prepilin-type processing-associated H-X9-DG protein
MRMNRRTMKLRSTHAFTLTELLVIVPVTAMLTTMLFALSNDAKQQLQAAACLSNMRQWGLGLMMYADDYNDYFPYVGDAANPCDTADNVAWYNLVPLYFRQKPLCQLYTAGTPPTPLTKGIWTCPSATNLNVNPTGSNPYFMYAMSVCWHMSGSTRTGIQRNRMTSPTNTILFCEEPEDNFSETSGKYTVVTRHFGGANFVFGDGHAGWIALTNFCRGGCPGCTGLLNSIQWNDSSGSGDWRPGIPYHWWAFKGAAVAGVN